MKINILKLIPKEWNMLDKGSKVEMFYKVKKGNQPKHFVFPKIIRVDGQFMEGLGLYLGDGDLNRKEKRHLNFTSIDKDIAKHALNFLQKYFLVKDKDMSFHIQYKKENKNLKKEWSHYLNISKEKILIRFSDRHRNEAIRIQVNGVVFRKMFEIIIGEILNKNFIQYLSLRRGILRGLFAAEGNVGVDYLEKKPYISQIDFNLHINENHIEKIITDCLKKEKIKHKITNRETRNSKEITIFNWSNYRKFWGIELFNLCKRKKDKFTKIMHNLKISCFLEDEYRENLFEKQNLNQRKIAKLINSYQGNVSKTIKGELGIILDGLCTLNKRINHENPVNKIRSINIGSLTNLENNKENRNFINYIYNIRNKIN